MKDRRHVVHCVDVGFQLTKTRQRAHEEVHHSVVVRSTSVALRFARGEREGRQTAATVGVSSGACDPIESAPQTFSVVVSIGTCAFLKAVAVFRIGFGQVQRHTIQTSCTHQFAHQRLQLPNGPSIHVQLGGTVVIHVIAIVGPSLTGNAIFEEEVHFKLGIQVVCVVHRAMKTRKTAVVHGPRQPVADVVEFVGRGEARRGEILHLNAAHGGGQARGSTRLTRRCVARGVFENAHPRLAAFLAVRVSRKHGGCVKGIPILTEKGNGVQACCVKGHRAFIAAGLP